MQRQVARSREDTDGQLRFGDHESIAQPAGGGESAMNQATAILEIEQKDEMLILKPEIDLPWTIWNLKGQQTTCWDVCVYRLRHGKNRCFRGFYTMLFACLLQKTRYIVFENHGFFHAGDGKQVPFIRWRLTIERAGSS